MLMKNLQRFTSQEVLQKLWLSSGLRRVSTTNKKGMLIDMRSDTVTKPSSGMKAAMINASLGDDVYREDPTVIEFEKRMSVLTGKESSLFVPSGTMGNLISILVHCGQRGSEVLLGDKSHIFLYEQGGMAQVGGVQAHIVMTKPDGTFDLDDLTSRVCYDDVHCPVTNLICLENTHNYCGGKILPLDYIDKLCEAAINLALPVHMDGARLLNAVVASGQSASRILQACDSASICFSKGLGAPVGSVIVGSEQFINRARRMRKVLGGGLRQAGMLAAAGLYALDHMVLRLADDHFAAHLIAQSIQETNNVYITIQPEDLHTNIGMILFPSDKITPELFCSRLMKVTVEEVGEIGEEIKVQMLPWSSSSVRYVTHCDISKDMTQAACAKVQFIIKEFVNTIK